MSCRLSTFSSLSAAIAAAVGLLPCRLARKRLRRRQGSADALREGTKAIALVEMTEEYAVVLVREIAASDSWLRLGIASSAIDTLLATANPGQIRRVITPGIAPIGAIVAHSDRLLRRVMRESW